MMTWGRVLRICVLALSAGLLGGTSGCGAPAPMHGVVLTQPAMAPPLRLRDARGATFDLASERGTPVLVYFGYLGCPDVCPTTLADWARVRRMLGPAGGRVRFVFVSVDPQRDTPQATAAYTWQFDSAFVGLAPTAAELEPIQKDWSFQTFREELPAAMDHRPSGQPGASPPDSTRAYGVAHPAQTFVIDRMGKLVMFFPPGMKPDDIAADLRRLM